ncbi:hypothetical protein [Capnocytophaga felis]|nr:hypothetical protein [Capnocytophaga felis]
MKAKTLEEQIIDYFHSNRENTVPAIARKFQVSEYKVHKIINKHLQQKKK